MNRSVFVLLFASIYLALTVNLAPANLVVALLVGVLVAYLVRPPLVRSDVRRWPSALWAASRYLLIMIDDVVRGGWEAARMIWQPRLPVRPGIIAIPSNARSQLGLALSIHAISLAPGELVIAVDEEAGILYTHCLNADDKARYIADAQRLRSELLEKIFS